jgi:hypothetical protein
LADRPCPLDGAAIDTPGASLCTGCTTNLRLDLEAVPAALSELDTALARQVSMPPASGIPGCPEGCEHGELWEDVCVAGVTLDLDGRASDARLALTTLLHGWIRVLLEEHPLPDLIAGPRCHLSWWTCEHHSCQDIHTLLVATKERELLLTTAIGQARLLHLHLPLIAGAMWLPDLARELHAALGEATAAVDRPADAAVVGPCPGCGQVIYAPAGAAVVRCVACGARGDRDEIRDASLAESRVLLTAVQLAAALGLAPGRDEREDERGRARVRQWVRRGRITQVRCDRDGRPLYRVSDGQALLSAGTGEEDAEEVTQVAST